MNDRNDKRPTPKRVIWTRILCGFLAFLMIGSLAFLAIELILDESNDQKKADAPEIVQTERL